MIKHTFCHLPSIGEKTEQKLWEQGVLSWENESVLTDGLFAEKYKPLLGRHLPASRAAYSNDDPAFFAQRLPENQLWRLFGDFRHSIAYFDIETTGLYFSQSQITSIALYDGQEVYTYVRGRNLGDFSTDINKYKIIVTFNGKCFDIPFIEYEFGIKLSQAHLDLRFILKSLGYSGGLKKCEHALGLNRGALEGVDGYFAVLLWQQFQQTREEKYLQTLLAYNVEDVINLEKLMVTAYNQKIGSLPGKGPGSLIKPIPDAATHPNPYSADSVLITKIKNSLSDYFRTSTR